MTTITVVRPSDRQLEIDAEHAGSRIQRLHADEPYAHILELGPGADVDLHSHSNSEIMAVIEGSVTVMGTECEQGSIIVIPASLEYDVVVGDAGALLLVVRTHHGASSRSSGAGL